MKLKQLQEARHIGSSPFVKWVKDTIANNDSGLHYFSEYKCISDRSAIKVAYKDLSKAFGPGDPYDDETGWGWQVNGTWFTLFNNFEWRHIDGKEDWFGQKCVEIELEINP